MDALAVHARAIEATLAAADAPTSRTVHSAVPAHDAVAKRDQQLMREREGGVRAPVRPEAMQEGLFLLSEGSAEARIAFEKALVAYVRNELPRRVSNVDSASDASLSRFMHALAVAVYSVTTSASIGDTAPASVDEFNILATVAVGAVASRAAAATIALAPAAEAVARTSSSAWSSDRARGDAARALASNVLSAARESWSSGAGLDGLAASADLQRAAGLDVADLRNALLGNWTVEHASNQGTSSSPVNADVRSASDPHLFAQPDPATNAAVHRLTVIPGSLSP